MYDTQYWERWSLPHGLLKVGTYLKKNGYQTKLIDCLAGDESRKVRMKKKSIVRIGSTVEKRFLYDHVLQPNEKIKYIFGKNIAELEQELIRIKQENSPFDSLRSEDSRRFPQPDEIWITSIMSYWWESSRDCILACKKHFPNAKIRLGGIYPTLAPEHAKKKLGLDNPKVIRGEELGLFDLDQNSSDLIVVGEIPEANDLDLDFELYESDMYTPPKYTILTTSRGCPRHCEYCAAYILSGRKVRVRDADLTMQEIKHKYAQGIREFCFYEDNLLMGKHNFKEILTRIIEDKDIQGIELHTPEGLEIRLVDTELLKLMRRAGFRRIYLPLETIDYDSIAQWKRDFYNLKDFEKAVRACEEAGFGEELQGINVFVLFGLPGENLQHVYNTAVYASNRTGSVIPMLFAPVPGTPLFAKFEEYFAEMNFDFQHLNGKLLPFLHYNQKYSSYSPSYKDYYQIEAFMLRINQKVRRGSFRIGGESSVSQAFRKVYTNYQSVYPNKYDIESRVSILDSDMSEFITEYHGGVAKAAKKDQRKHKIL